MNLNRIHLFATGDQINIVGDNEKFEVYDILQMPNTISNELLNYGHIINCIQHDDNDTIYIGYNSKEKRKECYEHYGKYLFEHASDKSAINWYKNENDWIFYEILNNCSFDNYYTIWRNAREWICNNIEKSYETVQWTRAGDCQYYKFKNKSDAMQFKLTWG